MSVGDYIDVRVTGPHERLARDVIIPVGPVMLQLSDGRRVERRIDYAERLDDHHVRLWLHRDGLVDGLCSRIA